MNGSSQPHLVELVIEAADGEGNCAVALRCASSGVSAADKVSRNLLVAAVDARARASAMFQGDVGAACRKVSQLHAASTLRWVLHIGDRDVAAAPWEDVLHPDLTHPLFGNGVHQVFRHGPGGPAPLETYEPPLRVLVYVACAIDDAIDPLAECDEIRRRLARPVPNVDFEIMVSRPFGDLAPLISTFAPHVLHIIGHGEIDGSDAPQLITHEPAPGVANGSIGPTELIGALGDDLPRLVVLNTCHLGGAGAAERGFAEALGLRGVAAVVGMQDRIGREASRRFTAALYDRLDALEDAASALAAARVAMGESFHLPVVQITTAPQSILAPDPRATRVPVTALRACPELSGVQRFVDRRELRRKLRARLDVSGGSLSIVAGGACIGKTALLLTYLHECRLRGAHAAYLDLAVQDRRLEPLELMRRLRDELRVEAHEAFWPFHRGIASAGKPPFQPVGAPLGPHDDPGIDWPPEVPAQGWRMLVKELWQAFRQLATGSPVVLILDHAFDVTRPPMIEDGVVDKVLKPLLEAGVRTRLPDRVQLIVSQQSTDDALPGVLAPFAAQALFIEPWQREDRRDLLMEYFLQQEGLTDELIGHGRRGIESLRRLYGGDWTPTDPLMQSLRVTR